MADLRDFLARYTEEVYLARDPEAARRFIADPCLRHEQGELIVMSLADNIKRITGFVEQFPNLNFANTVVVAEDDHLVSCYEIELAPGEMLSGVEVFKVVDGKITETWNTKALPGRWG